MIQSLNFLIALANISLCYSVLSSDLSDKVLSDVEACKISLIDNPTEMSRCSQCDGWVHNASIHCEKCNKCVANFDHHSTWLNNCIGMKNFRAFFGFLSAYFCLSAFTVYVAVRSLLLAQKVREEYGTWIMLIWMAVGVLMTILEILKGSWTFT